MKATKYLKRAYKWLEDRSQRIAVILLAATVLFILICPYITTIIPSGHVGVFYRIWGGTDLERVYGEGIHFYLPWNRMFDYDCRIQRKDFAVNVLTMGGLQVEVDLSALYNVKKKQAPGLHFRVGPRYAEKVIVPGAIFAVRGIVGNLHQSDIYNSNPIDIQDKVFALLDKILKQEDDAISLHGIFVRRIKLPDRMEAAIEAKHEAEQNVYQERYRILRAYERYKKVYLQANTIRMAQRLINKGLTEQYLRYSGIKATRDLAASPNAKLVIVGGKDGLPLLLNPDTLKTGQAKDSTPDAEPKQDTADPGTIPKINPPSLSKLDENIKKLNEFLEKAETGFDKSILTTIPKQLLEFDDIYDNGIFSKGKSGARPLKNNGSPKGAPEKTN